jgi:hypothetical protein
MTLILFQDAKTFLINKLEKWTSKLLKMSSGSSELKHWKQMAGWFNWALNVYPLLHPAFNNVYKKIRGKGNHKQCIYISNAIQNDLS